MTPHSLFYYPYGSFYDEQAPLLKAAALYFDKLYILDPEKASGGGLGIGNVAKDVKLLEDKNVRILERVSPEEVLGDHEAAIAAAIRADLEDPEFLDLCERSGRATEWLLALAKVPKAIRDDPQHQEYARRKPKDRAMQRLMGELPHSLAPALTRYSETYIETVHDQTSPGIGDDIIEYRCAHYPLPLGESIMVNHALFGGLLHAEATPITDDPFHSQILALKLQRARQIPEVRQILEDRAARQDLLAYSTLTDRQLNLPCLSPRMSLEEILEYRQKHDSELEHARERLGWLARRIREQPYSTEFETELERQMIPDIADELEEIRKARDAWLKSKRARLALKAAGIGVAVAATAVSLVLSPTPLLPVGLGLLGSAGIPGLELALDWKDGRKETTENGLHYLLMV